MSSIWRRVGPDLAAALAGLSIAASDLALQEAYHRVASQLPGLTRLAAAAVLVFVGVTITDLLFGADRAQPLRRLAVLVSSVFAWYLLVGAEVTSAWRAGDEGSWPAMLLAASAVVVLFVQGLRAGTNAWAQIRAALVVLPVLFVGSQLVLARWWSRDVDWPVSQQEGGAKLARTRIVTMILLLDELNSRSAGPILEVLAKHGLKPKFKAVPSVGPNTINVLPAMFDGRTFARARACGPTTVCSGLTVLDFSRVHASRPDIDVVGFFHPYCAMTGLRSCQREEVGLGLDDAARWRCAIHRRLGTSVSTADQHCEDVSRRYWEAMVERVLSDVRAAPALTQGGLLFAHVPLPHPPGAMANGTLQQHYEENIRRATALVEEMLQIASHSGLQQRLIITSDHPLRLAMWCAGLASYAAQGCDAVAALQDDKVPVIVAGAGAPDLAGVKSNLGIFSLLTRWTAEFPSAMGGR